MRNFKSLDNHKAVRWVIMMQVAITAIVGLFMLLTQSVTIAISAVSGGAVGFLTSLIYAKRMAAPEGANVKTVIRAHYSAEAYKLVFTILLFSLVFTQFKDVHALPLFATYIATLAVYWAALIFV
jgi:ATP synthase protein I